MNSVDQREPAGFQPAPDSSRSAAAQRILADGARQYLGLERLDLALALANLAISDDEDNADAHSVVANIFDREGDWQGSLARLRRANQLAPHAPQVRLNLAMALLRQGDYREGFALYEARTEKPTWSGFATAESRAALRHLMLRPGQPVAERRVVVLAEQGLGDGVMFARYIPKLVERGARVAVACNPTMRPFFARVSGIETLLAPPADQPLAQINLSQLQFDAWVPLLSLAHWFGTDAASISTSVPYWHPDQERVAHWRRQLAAMGRPGVAKVGLVFQANPGGAAYAEKSMTVDEVRSLVGLDGFDVVNLQHGPAGRELAKAAPGAIDLLPDGAPLDDYAAAIAATDLLISVDTMAAHCAGAMGHPVWLAVPQSPHWAWSLTGDATPWYPSMKMIRQARRRDWSDVVASLAERLRERFASAGASREPSGSPVVAAGAAALDDRQSAAVLAGVGQALAECGRPDFIPALAALVARLDGAGESGIDALADMAEQAGDRDAELAHRLRAAAGGVPQLGLKLASAQLLAGDCARGFASYEARRAVPLWREQSLLSAGSHAVLAQRSLRPGDAVAGRHIVVFTEQGLGDTFFAARFLSLLAERGARLTLVCRAPMRAFFARLPFLDAILSPPEDQPASKIDLNRLSFDAVCPLLSLPFVLQLASAEDAPKPPYLGVDPAQQAAWRARYDREGRTGCRKIGLVWQANPSNRALANRSMAPQDLAPLASLVDIDWVNLQPGPAGRGLHAILPHVIDVTRAPLPLDEFAAALAATDLVISVDTMAAHCAGALGHPAVVALPRTPAWYWGRGGNSSWYPGARLVQRVAQMTWADVVATVAAQLSGR